MVQLWPEIPAEVLCDMYLNSCLNEGLNLLIRHHMAKGHRIFGYAETGCIDCNKIPDRIYSLISEMNKRGKQWTYRFTDSDDIICTNYFNARGFPFESFRRMEDAIRANPAKLANKCLVCRYRETRCKGKETCVERLKANGLI
jgi:hypothetical protein